MKNVALFLTRQGLEILLCNFTWLHDFRQWRVRIILMSCKKSIDIGMLMNTILIAKVFQAITDFREYNLLKVTIMSI